MVTGVVVAVAAGALVSVTVDTVVVASDVPMLTPDPWVFYTCTAPPQHVEVGISNSSSLLLH